MIRAVAMLGILVVANFAPDAMAYAGLGTARAWDYVFGGLEAQAVWMLAGLSTPCVLARCVAAWGAFEASQRPICRLVFPMDRPVVLPEGVAHLCDAATGVPMSLISAAAALFLAALAQEFQRVQR